MMIASRNEVMNHRGSIALFIMIKTLAERTPG